MRGPVIPTGSSRRRVAMRVEGTVQGVGFRPFVYRLAQDLGLGGSVRNDGSGVALEVEGDAAAVEHFVRRLATEAPPLARVVQLRVSDLPPCGEDRFAILASDAAGRAGAAVAADAAPCAACLAELDDSADRRFRYPFINCTDCGPRFTIVQGTPYDRLLTTMHRFAMCPACRAEYHDPANRRFHAQPNACPACGPTAQLTDAAGGTALRTPGDADLADAVAPAAAGLLGGRIVAVKGVGGYQLACRADDAQAVARLRAAKHRPAKPFALMARDLEQVRRLVRLTMAEERLLTSRARPIVLARRQADAPVADAVAPGRRELGVMLPASPLHHLLLDSVGLPLVMTSGNRSDDPIAFRDEEARERLAGIADLFLIHDRPIHTRVDDSVVRSVCLGGAQRPLMLRRARGYVPAPLMLPVAAPPLLAVGAQLKAAFCVARDRRAWMGPHLGDLESYEVLCAFTEGIQHFQQLFGVQPRVVAHDLHPEYLSTKFARELGLRTVSVQHHHAHLAACLAEHGETGPALGLIFDGTGYGADGTVWGGELLLGGVAAVQRVGHLWPVPLPGGAAAVREPWRMACAWLAELEPGVPELPASLRGHVDPARWSAVARLAHTGLGSPRTSSMGRLFDAVAALCGLHPYARYEGEAALALEAAVDPTETAAYPLPLTGTSRGPYRTPAGAATPPVGSAHPLVAACEEQAAVVLDARETVRAVQHDLRRGSAVGRVAARFHNAVAAAAAAAATEVRDRAGTTCVVLSGGVFQNVVLLERTVALLHTAGLRVLVPERLPPNDGGIAFGQAAVAAAVLQAEEPRVL